jgi:hypothetical protein
VFKEAPVSPCLKLSSSTTKPIEVQTEIRNMRGGAQSTLVRCTNGKLYVLKMSPNPQGLNVLANEFLGAHLIRGLGLSSPRTQPLTVTRQTLETCPSLAFEFPSENRLPQSGIHFGSEFLDASGSRMYDWIPESWEDKIVNQDDFVGIYVFDIWTSHQDHRQCIFRQNQQNLSIKAFFIDNGHLFGGPDWASVTQKPRSLFLPRALPPLLMGRSIDAWISRIRSNAPRLLRQAISRTPVRWYAGNIIELEHILLQRLDDLANLVDYQLSKTKLIDHQTHWTNAEISLLQRHRLLPSRDLDQDGTFRGGLKQGIQGRNGHRHALRATY